MNFAVLLVLISAALPNVGQWDPDIDINVSLERVLKWFWDNIFMPIYDGLHNILSGVVLATRAPFDALVKVWSNWWMQLLGMGWYSPIIGVIVVIASLGLLFGLWKLFSPI